jgi:hypothetical protein
MAMMPSLYAVDRLSLAVSAHTPIQVLAKLAQDPDPQVRTTVMDNPTLPTEYRVLLGVVR